MLISQFCYAYKLYRKDAAGITSIISVIAAFCSACILVLTGKFVHSVESSRLVYLQYFTLFPGQIYSVDHNVDFTGTT